MLGARLRACQRNMELITPHLHLRPSFQPPQTLLFASAVCCLLQPAIVSSSSLHLCITPSVKHGFSWAARTCLAADKAPMTLIEPSTTNPSAQRLPQSRPSCSDSCSQSIHDSVNIRVPPDLCSPPIDTAYETTQLVKKGARRLWNCSYG